MICNSCSIASSIENTETTCSKQKVCTVKPKSTPKTKFFNFKYAFGDKLRLASSMERDAQFFTFLVEKPAVLARLQHE